MKKRGTYDYDRLPAEHLVSATFEEPFEVTGKTMGLRWWYGNKKYEQRGDGTSWMEDYRDNVRENDLKTMDRYVWGTAPPQPYFTDFGYLYPSPNSGPKRDVR